MFSATELGSQLLDSPSHYNTPCSSSQHQGQKNELRVRLYDDAQAINILQKLHFGFRVLTFSRASKLRWDSLPRRWAAAATCSRLPASHTTAWAHTRTLRTGRPLGEGLCPRSANGRCSEHIHSGQAGLSNDVRSPS